MKALLKRRPFRLIDLVFAWGLLSVASVAVLWRYEAAPGAVGAVAIRWPADSSLRLAGGSKCTLVLALHPHCPCSRATLGELARIMARCGDGLNATALFVRPSDTPDGWEQTDLMRNAAAIPGVTVRTDPDAKEVSGFGAETSGHAMLYSPMGDLLFQGGITSARGHEGDNSGSEAIVAAVLQHVQTTSVVPSTFVYGCPLQSPDEAKKCAAAKGNHQ